MKKILLSAMALGLCVTMVGCGGTSASDSAINNLSHQLDDTSNMISKVQSVNPNDLAISKSSIENITSKNAYSNFESTQNALLNEDNYKKVILLETGKLKNCLEKDVKLSKAQINAVKDLTSNLCKYTNSVSYSKNELDSTIKSIVSLKKKTEKNAEKINAKFNRLACNSNTRSAYYENIIKTLEELGFYFDCNENPSYPENVNKPVVIDNSKQLFDNQGRPIADTNNTNQNFERQTNQTQNIGSSTNQNTQNQPQNTQNSNNLENVNTQISNHTNNEQVSNQNNSNQTTTEQNKTCENCNTLNNAQNLSFDEIKNQIHPQTQQTVQNNDNIACENCEKTDDNKNFTTYPAIDERPVVIDEKQTEKPRNVLQKNIDTYLPENEDEIDKKVENNDIDPNFSRPPMIQPRNQNMMYYPHIQNMMIPENYTCGIGTMGNVYNRFGRFNVGRNTDTYGPMARNIDTFAYPNGYANWLGMYGANGAVGGNFAFNKMAQNAPMAQYPMQYYMMGGFYNIPSNNINRLAMPYGYVNASPKKMSDFNYSKNKTDAENQKSSNEDYDVVAY